MSTKGPNNWIVKQVQTRSVVHERAYYLSCAQKIISPTYANTTHMHFSKTFRQNRLPRKNPQTEHLPLRNIRIRDFDSAMYSCFAHHLHIAHLLGCILTVGVYTRMHSYIDVSVRLCQCVIAIQELYIFVKAGSVRHIQTSNPNTISGIRIYRIYMPFSLTPIWTLLHLLSSEMGFM